MAQTEQTWNANTEQLLLWILRSLVDFPKEVQVELIRTDAETTFRVTVAQPDMGRVIGKDGQTVKAIKTLLSGIAMAGKIHGAEVRYKLQIMTRN
jgi:predicted RNA-binding protein YlqC (UPF0109 family)